MIRFVALVLLILAPLVAWAMVKPLRVVAPELLGVVCRVNVCVDDPKRFAEAQALYEEAALYVDAKVAHLRTVPRAIFCSSQACAESFGIGKPVAGRNVGTVAILIAPKGWYPYYVRHELIHHLQGERFGSLRNWLFKPEWFREGMAYSLSADPRRPLPQPLEGFRAEFEAWLGRVGAARLWEEAERI
jgi:hypothetical protein